MQALGLLGAGGRSAGNLSQARNRQNSSELQKKYQTLDQDNHKRVKGDSASIARYAANINACRNPAVDIYRLITLIRTRTRLDLEQAAGVVVSTFVSAGRAAEAARLLVPELTGVLASASMWPPRNTDELTRRNTLNDGAAMALANAASAAHFWCAKAAGGGGLGGSDPPRNYAQLVRLLLRVRRVMPRSQKRCLYIPAWLFEAAGITPPTGHARFLEDYVAGLAARGVMIEGIKGYRYPCNPVEADSIVVSKHGFRVIQRRLFRMFAFWDAGVQLRWSVRNLEDLVLYASEWIIEKLRETEDVAQVAFWFFGLQRRLQLRVVSDDYWTEFLKKGEGELVYQNNLRLKSGFEMALARVAGQSGLNTLATGDDTSTLIDRTCLLMKDYVDVYGHGKKENLVFTQGEYGGQGRGPVDEYNMLCDILTELKQRAKEEGIEKVPGPVYKFLAKDIMHWNNAWKDDAFAGGRTHGWEGWVHNRGLIADNGPD